MAIDTHLSIHVKLAATRPSQESADLLLSAVQAENKAKDAKNELEIVKSALNLSVEQTRSAELAKKSKSSSTDRKHNAEE